MSKVIDMTNQRFGRLQVIRRGDNDKHGKAQWWCQCDCGSPEKLISGAALRRGLTTSCGCNKNEKLKKYNDQHTVDETGNTYGYLTVLRRIEDAPSKDGRAQWLCQCKCGNQIITTGRLLRQGKKMSCGCLKKSKGELEIEKLLEQQNIPYSEQYAVYIEHKEYGRKQKHPYYFDFAIFNNQQNLLYLIEYDGAQHFNYKANSEFWNNKEQFDRQQIRDKLKNEWCKKNNIPLIRIPFWHLDELKIEDLLLETSEFVVE